MKDWEKNLRKVDPYVAGEQPKEKDIIKLNTNENPYPPSPSVCEMAKMVECDTFRKYPDSHSDNLIQALAAYHKLDPKQIFVGVGSDDVLSMCFLTFFNSQKPILFPDITYSFYPVWAKVYNIPFITPQVDNDYCICIEDYMQENGGVVIANPNAPTSIEMSQSNIEKIIEANKNVIVIVDEAYVDFGGTSVLPLLEKYDNLVVVRTYSKSRSMAGMRIGYAMAGERLIQALNDVKESVNSYTMNQESILLGAASIKDEEYFQRNISKIIDTREWSAVELKKMGFDVKDSRTNFLFVSHPDKCAKDIFEELKKRKIFVRYFNSPRIDNCLRITIGTEEEMKKTIEVLKQVI